MSETSPFQPVELHDSGPAGSTELKAAVPPPPEGESTNFKHTQDLILGAIDKRIAKVYNETLNNPPPPDFRGIRFRDVVAWRSQAGIAFDMISGKGTAHLDQNDDGIKRRIARARSELEGGKYLVFAKRGDAQGTMFDDIIEALNAAPQEGLPQQAETETVMTLDGKPRGTITRKQLSAEHIVDAEGKKWKLQETSTVLGDDDAAIADFFTNNINGLSASVKRDLAYCVDVLKMTEEAAKRDWCAKHREAFLSKSERRIELVRE